MTGNVLAFSAADTLALGGTGTNGIFNISNIGPASQFQTFGLFRKRGSNTWSLIGTSNVVTDWTIEEGTLAMNGTILSTTTVNAGATLAGSGTNVGNVTSFGTISPCNSIGTLTIQGDYIGNGGILLIEAILGDDFSPADKLIITGNASGTTTVYVINLGGLGAPTIANGIPIIETGSSTPTAFTLGAPVQAGAFTYNLFLGGINNTNPTTWYLRSSGGVLSGLRNATQVIPFSPLLAQEYGATTIGTLHQRIGAQETMPYPERGEEKGRGIKSIWSRLIGLNGKQTKGTETFHYDVEDIQLGTDFYRAIHPTYKDHVGIYGVIGKGKSRTHLKTTTMNTTLGHINLDAPTGGIYWTRYGPQDQYIDTVFQATRYRNRISSDQQTIRSHFTGYTTSIEVGHPLPIKALIIEPQAQVIYQNLDQPPLRDNASIISFNETNSFRGRLGIRIPKEGIIKQRLYTVALITNVWKEFLGENRTTFRTLQGTNPMGFIPNTGDTWAEVGAEGTIQVTRYAYLYGTAKYMHTIQEKRRAIGGNMGIRVNL